MEWFIALWDSKIREEVVSKLHVDGDNPEAVYRDVIDFPSKYKSFNEFRESMLWEKKEEKNRDNERKI